MRRKDREITDYNEIIDIIKKCDVCRLAFHDEGYPYILPLNFGMQEENGSIVLYFHGALNGKKYELMRKDNRVGFEMDCLHILDMDEEKKECSMDYESVIGTGNLEFVAEKEKYQALQSLMAHYHQEEFQFNIAMMEKTNVLKLRVETITGKARRMVKK